MARTPGSSVALRQWCPHATSYFGSKEIKVESCALARSVTLSDDEAKRRGTQKSVIERMAPPTFDVAVEIIDRACWRVHLDLAAAVDAELKGACAPAAA
jgi:hypothetical protein